jgi:hypothetical protein
LGTRITQWWTGIRSPWGFWHQWLYCIHHSLWFSLYNWCMTSIDLDCSYRTFLLKLHLLAIYFVWCTPFNNCLLKKVFTYALFLTSRSRRLVTEL